MIDVKCMGLISRTIKFDALSDYTANIIKEKIATELKVKSVDVVLKSGGKQLDGDDVVTNGAKLLSIIKPPSVKPAAPAPTLDTPPKQCIGWKRVCQFYTSGTGEYCSLCDKRYRRETAPQTLVTTSITNIEANNLVEHVEQVLDLTIPIDESHCFRCNKHVGLLGFSCKCNRKYCALHRYPETHSCSFDHKEHNKRKLENELLGGLCNTNKISKI